MLIINDDRNMPGTERQILEWMRAWPDAPGVAISGCRIPQRDNAGAYAFADLVLITPHACAVIEVKGLLEAVSGTLSCPGADPWSMDEMFGKPVYIRRADVNPFDQLYECMFHLDEAVAELDGPAPISGLVVVFAAPGHRVAIADGERPHEMSVIPGELEPLREWFEQVNSEREQWSAELTHELLWQLQFGNSVTVNDLLTEGFTAAAIEPDEFPAGTIPSEPIRPVDVPHIPPVSPPRYVNLDRPAPPEVVPQPAEHPTPPWYPDVAEQLSQFRAVEPRSPQAVDSRARRLLENAAAVLFAVTVFAGLLLYGQHHLADVHARHAQVTVPVQPPAAAR